MKLIRTANCVTKPRSQHVKPSITSEKIITEFELNQLIIFPKMVNRDAEKWNGT